MSDIILKAENISKQYRLGLVGTGTLTHDLNRLWHRLRGKEDPYLKVGAVNDRSAATSSDYVWALQDINFEVKRGEILGIIGKNGAGKSTLLKILSRITSPTTGSIKTKGRIASLLEVGTGMHPELTGRENIFLNGAILGMNKTEISSKIDEIIEFSGCQMYIDTPVKRYSSGMRVRLGFAVAAFLEPDILVVDEVLAVGDAEFQKKAIGKMQDISNTNGRTVLFVSHNMAAVKSLCTRAIVINNGETVFDGNTNDAIDKYYQLSQITNNIDITHLNYIDAINNVVFKIKGSKKSTDVNQLLLGGNLLIEIGFDLIENITNCTISINVLNTQKELICHVIDEDDQFKLGNLRSGSKVLFTIELLNVNLIPGHYTIDLWIGQNHVSTIYEIKNSLSFDLLQSSYTQRRRELPKHSKVYLKSIWNVA
jgi:lipopolysaccharide transport system ATP-binding protein